MDVGPTRFARHRGQRIAYRSDGPDAGEPVVLQHGWTSDKARWLDYVETLTAHGYRCLSIDSLGHGESDKPTDARLYARDQRAADVVAVLDAEGVSRAHMVGYSMGGWIACCMAEHHPERLSSLLIGGHCPGTGTNEEAGGWITGEEYSFDRILDEYGFDWPDEILPAMRHTYDALEDVAGHEDAVANAGVPVLLWKGRGERVICDKGAQVAARRGWTFVAVDGDHVEAAMNHDAILPHIIEFLGRGT